MWCASLIKKRERGGGLRASALPQPPAVADTLALGSPYSTWPPALKLPTAATAATIPVENQSENTAMKKRSRNESFIPLTSPIFALSFFLFFLFFFFRSQPSASPLLPRAKDPNLKAVAAHPRAVLAAHEASSKQHLFFIRGSHHHLSFSA